MNLAEEMRAIADGKQPEFTEGDKLQLTKAIRHEAERGRYVLEYYCLGKYKAVRAYVEDLGFKLESYSRNGDGDIYSIIITWGSRDAN